MKYVLGIDIGTSSAKVAAVDLNGDIRALAHQEYDLQSPHGGWSEEDPAVWWDACVHALREALRQLPSAEGIEAIGVSSQMHSLVVLDQNLRNIRPSILHNDARTGEQTRALCALLGSDAEKITRNPIVNGMTLPFVITSLKTMREFGIFSWRATIYGCALQERSARIIPMRPPHCCMILTGVIGLSVFARQRTSRSNGCRLFTIRVNWRDGSRLKRREKRDFAQACP